MVSRINFEERGLWALHMSVVRDAGDSLLKKVLPPRHCRDERGPHSSLLLNFASQGRGSHLYWKLCLDPPLSFLNQIALVAKAGATF